LIAGTSKAGTTSLYQHLTQHPDVFMPAVKEPHYFVQGYGIDLEGYLQLFAQAADKQARGEASTSYLFCSESPAWIRAVLPEARIIVLLRNPAERAFSLYNWMVMEGYEYAGTLEEALRLETERMTDGTFLRSNPEFYADFLYYTTGLYYRQVKTYRDLFGSERLKVFLFEDLVQDPVRVSRESFEFLGLDASFRPRCEVHNVSRQPRSVLLQHWLRTRAASLLPARAVARLMRWNLKLGSKPEKPVALIRELQELYKPDIQQLEVLLGKDLTAWYS
jgi:hypothetical protein